VEGWGRETDRGNLPTLDFAIPMRARVLAVVGVHGRGCTCRQRALDGWGREGEDIEGKQCTLLRET